MSAQQLQHSKYGFSKTVDLPYKDAVKAEGFGVLCEIDIKEKLKEKSVVEHSLSSLGRQLNLAKYPSACA